MQPIPLSSGAVVFVVYQNTPGRCLKRCTARRSTSKIASVRSSSSTTTPLTDRGFQKAPGRLATPSTVHMAEVNFPCHAPAAAAATRAATGRVPIFFAASKLLPAEYHRIVRPTNTATLAFVHSSTRPFHSGNNNNNSRAIFEDAGRRGFHIKRFHICYITIQPPTLRKLPQGKASSARSIFSYKCKCHVRSSIDIEKLD